MRTIETEVYEFHELSEQAKENAKIELVSEYFWSDEAIASLYAFAEEIGIKITNYSIDWDNYANSSIDWEWIVDEHKDDLSVEELTGYIMDYPLIETWNRDKDVDDAIYSWLYNCHQDYIFQFTDEYMIDHCIANEYEFTKEGTLI
tara:strand:+ start:191 stop:628 length:438 start_codon:yes stop_codon:yes gene_type:complete